MNFLLRNIAVLHVFALSAAFSWICGGTRSDLLLPVIPWFLLVVFAGMLLFPQNRSHESFPEARDRVWRAIAHDRLTWTCLAFLLLLTVPFLNRGLCPACDAEAIAAGVDPAPPAPFLPSCVDLADHLGVYIWFAPALAAVVAVKHALLKRGKRLLLEMLVWNAVALAALGFVQQASGAEAPLWGLFSKSAASGYFFSTWGYASMAGCFFTLFLAIGCGIWQHRLAEVAAMPGDHEFDGVKAVKHRVLYANYMAFAVAVLYIAAVDTLSVAAITLSTLVLVLAAALGFACCYQRMTRRGRVRLAIAAVLAVVVVALLVARYAPMCLRSAAESPSAKVVFRDKVGHGFRPIAMAVWRSNKLFGVGGWGYRHLCAGYLTEQEAAAVADGWMRGAGNVHDDYVQFLCEHGVAGASLLLAILAMLVWPIARAWRRFYNWARFARPGEAPARPIAVYCMPAPVLCTLVGCAAALVQAVGDCPFRTPAVLGSFLVVLACADGFFPKEG